MCRMRVNDVDSLASNHRAQSKSGTGVQFAERIRERHVESSFLGAARQRFARPCSDNRPMPAWCQLGGKPQRLSLAAAPAVLRVDVQHAKSHRAQLPGVRAGAQDSGHGTRDMGHGT